MSSYMTVVFYLAMGGFVGTLAFGKAYTKAKSIPYNDEGDATFHGTIVGGFSGAFWPLALPVLLGVLVAKKLIPARGK